MEDYKDKNFLKWQWRIIIGAMLGYSFYYFVRKNFSFAMPVLKDTYGITNESFGIVLTLVGLIYAVSKFVNGVIADKADARWHISIGLAACVILNFVLGFSDRISTMICGQAEGPDFVGTMVVVMAILMIINNIFQGCGAAPCNKLMQYWVPQKELATKTSIWNTSHSIGAGIASVMCGLIVAKTGDWRLCFWIPAAIAAVGVLICVTTIRDCPSKVGLKELPKSKIELQTEENSESHKEFIKRMVFRSPVIWILAITDLFVYIVRFAVLDWGPTFLKSNGLSLELAGWIVAIFEVAGCAGMVCAGWLTDKLFKGKAQRMCAVEMMLVTLCMIGTYFVKDLDSPIPMLVLLVITGFLLYGPQTLLGVVAFKKVTKKGGATAVGFIGFVSYLSTLVTGWGLGRWSDIHGWDDLFLIMAGAAFIGFVLVAPLWNMKENELAEQEKK